MSQNDLCLLRNTLYRAYISGMLEREKIGLRFDFSRPKSYFLQQELAVFGCKKWSKNGEHFLSPTLPKYGGYDNCMMSISLSCEVTFKIDDLNDGGNVEKLMVIVIMVGTVIAMVVLVVMLELEFQNVAWSLSTCSSPFCLFWQPSQCSGSDHP